MYTDVFSGISRYVKRSNSEVTVSTIVILSYHMNCLHVLVLLFLLIMILLQCIVLFSYISASMLINLHLFHCLLSGPKFYVYIDKGNIHPLMDRCNEYWRWSRPPLGKRRRVLRKSRPFYQDCWHIGLGLVG